MDFGLLFLLGMLGAILAVYPAKQEVVPEFRVRCMDEWMWHTDFASHFV
jgi:hypothetical protein